MQNLIYPFSHVEEIDGTLFVHIEVLGTHGNIYLSPVDSLINSQFKKSLVIWTFPILALLTSLVSVSSTIRLSLGTRPVLLPELQHRAPVSVMLDGPTVGSGDSMCSGIMAYS